MTSRSQNQPFKQRLLRKAHAFLGVSRLQTQLAQVHEDAMAAQGESNRLQHATMKSVQALCRTSERTAQVAAESNATLEQPAARLDACLEKIEQLNEDALPPGAPDPTASTHVESLRAIERQGLCVFGCARSGTSILMKSLNRSGEIYLLAEPDLSLHQHVTDFVGYFNQKHVSWGNRRIKGTYLAPPLSPENGPLDALLRLGRDYRYVGHKRAVGPHEYPEDWQQRFLDFHAKYFLRGMYIYIIRAPVESIWSMHKMFPARPIPRLFAAWLSAVALSLEAYHAFPNSRVVFFEDLGDSLIDRLAEWLDVSIPTLPGTFSCEHVRSSLTSCDIPEPLRPLEDLCRECSGLYHDLRDSFSSEEFVYDGSKSEWAFFDARWRHIAALLGRLSAGETDHEELTQKAA